MIALWAIKDMKLNANKFAMSAGVVGAIWYVVCVFVVAIAPRAGMAIFSQMTHLLNMEVTQIIRFPEAIFGFIWTVALSYVTVYIFAWLYNKLI